MRASDVLDLSPDEAVKCLRSLASPAPDESLPFLVDVAVAEKETVSDVARELLDRVAQEPGWLSSSLRHDYLSRWWPLDRERTRRALRRHPESLGLAAACSLVYDGHVREAAIINLAALHKDVALPYLMFRASDWVKAIAKIASRAAQTQIPRAGNDGLVASLSAFRHLTLNAKEDGQPVAAAYRRELTSRAGLLPEVRRHASPREYGWLLDQRLVGPGEDWIGLLRGAIARRDPANVAIAVRLVKELPEEGQLSLLDSLRESRVPQARTEAMSIAHQRDRQDILRAGLHDANWRVRNDARFYLQKKGVTGFAEEYRARFPSPSAVAGFGEVASDSELAVLIPYVDNSWPAVRREAIRALGRREVRGASAAIERHLEDDSASVVRAAVKALRSLGGSISMDRVEGLLGDVSRETHLRRAMQSAIDLVPRWDRLLAILRMSQTGALVSVPSTLIRAWLSKRAVDVAGPTVDQCRKAREELLRASPYLHPDTAEAVRLELEHWAARLKC